LFPVIPQPRKNLKFQIIAVNTRIEISTEAVTQIIVAPHVIKLIFFYKLSVFRKAQVFFYNRSKSYANPAVGSKIYNFSAHE